MLMMVSRKGEAYRGCRETIQANTVNNMRLKLRKDQAEKERLDDDRGRDVMPGVPQFIQGGGSGMVDVKNRGQGHGIHAEDSDDMKRPGGIVRAALQ
jgi:hypothetical protein